MLAKAALIVNALALLPAIGGSVLLGVLASVFLGSVSDSDRQLGLLAMFVGIPLLLAGPGLGLWLALKPGASWSLPLSCGLGVVWLLLAAAALWFLPALLEAAVRP